MDDEIILRNPSRRIVPAAIAAAILVMFFPPLALAVWESSQPLKALFGALLMLALAGWFFRSAFKAVVEARFTTVTLTLRSAKESRYTLSQVTRWHFAVPRGLPTQAAPATNALLFVRLEDGAGFRGEVTVAEAARLAAVLPHVALANA